MLFLLQDNDCKWTEAFLVSICRNMNVPIPVIANVNFYFKKLLCFT